MGTMVAFDRYYMKTRGVHYDKVFADISGIKRIYNYTSLLDYMGMEDLKVWTDGLYDKNNGEAVLIESAVRVVEGNSLYVMTCIVFYNYEQCNLYYIRNKDQFKVMEGFLHLMN